MHSAKASKDCYTDARLYLIIIKFWQTIMHLHLQNKVALVSGANRGTGETIAKQLQDEGAETIMHSNSESGFHYIQERYPTRLAIWGDISHDEGYQQCIKQLWEQVDHVDILVNNYGTASSGKWQDFDEQTWLDIYQKNVLSASRLISGLIPQMKNLGWGRIIQLSTIGSLKPNSQMPHYYASKAAMANMTVSLSQEMANTGVTVNTISPGLILTEELQAGYYLRAKKKGWGENWDEIEKALVKEDFPNPSGRIARREEIADLVCFLASERANFINGQNIRIDGGALELTI